MKKKINVYFVFISILILSIIYFSMIPYMVNVLSASIKYNITNEIRDFAGIRVIQLILDGINPYDFNSIQLLQVPSAYIYNIPNCLIAALICKIFGLSIIESLYIVNLLLLILTSLFLYLAIRKFLNIQKFVDSILLFLTLFILSTTCFSLFGTLLFNLRVDTFGICILSSLLYYVQCKKSSVFVLSTQIMLLFLTKFYLVIFALPVFLYIFIVNRKRAYHFLLACIIEGLALLFVLNTFFPLYLTNTIYVQYACGSNKLQLYSLIKNIARFCVKYFSFTITSILGLIFIIYRKFIKEKKRPFQLIKENATYQYLYFLLLSILSAFLALLYIGQNGDDGFKYFQSMLLPPLLIFSFLILHESLIQIRKDVTVTKKITILLSCIFTLFSFFQFERPQYSSENLTSWEKLYSYLDDYNYEDMYLSQIASSYLLRDDNKGFYRAYFDDGHLEYFRNWKNSSISTLFKEEDKIESLVNLYWNSIDYKIASGDFEIVIDNGKYEEELKKNYINVETLELKNDTLTWYVNVWIKQN